MAKPIIAARAPNSGRFLRTYPTYTVRPRPGMPPSKLAVPASPQTKVAMAKA